jgi:hypothetical protein
MSVVSVLLAATWVAICAIAAISKIIDGLERDMSDHEE